MSTGTDAQAIRVIGLGSAPSIGSVGNTFTCEPIGVLANSCLQLADGAFALICRSRSGPDQRIRRCNLLSQALDPLLQSIVDQYPAWASYLKTSA